MVDLRTDAVGLAEVTTTTTIIIIVVVMYFYSN